MRKLLLIPVLAALVFAGYWFAASRALEGSLDGWFQQRQAEGWVAEYSAISSGGFPARFEIVVTDLQLADPDTGVAWTASRFTIQARSHKPNDIRAIWPSQQTLATPFESISISADRMEAGIAFVPGTRLEVRTIDADLATLGFASTSNWTSSLDRGHLSATALGDRENAYRIRFEATGVTPTDTVRTTLDPAGIMPKVIDGVVTEAKIGFDAPWDRFAVEDARPQITEIDLDDLRASWGKVELRAAGKLTVDANGTPEGRIMVKATNWREMLAMAENLGLLPEPLIPTIERFFEVLAQLSGPPETIDAPLSIQKGFVSFGPIPLGPAPDFTIR